MGSTGAINIKHLKEFLELVGPPLGKKKVTGIWLKALRAEVSAIPGSSSQEISFKNLFLLLTTRMLGADALCENDSGEMEIELIQARKLGAQQAVMSTVLEEGKVITSPQKGESDAQNAYKSADQLTLQEKLSQAEKKVEESPELRAMVNAQKPLTTKEKIQLMIRKRHLEEAEATGDEQSIKAAQDRVDAVSRPNIFELMKAAKKKKQEEEDEDKRKRPKSSFISQDRLGKLEAKFDARLKSAESRFEAELTAERTLRKEAEAIATRESQVHSDLVQVVNKLQEQVKQLQQQVGASPNGAPASAKAPAAAAPEAKETPKATARRALLSGLRSGKLEEAVQKLEADEAAAATP